LKNRIFENRNSAVLIYFIMSLRSLAKPHQYMFVEDLMKNKTYFGESGIDESTRMTTREIMLFTACNVTSLLEYRPHPHVHVRGYVLLHPEPEHDIPV
jgi:hypothetical protein